MKIDVNLSDIFDEDEEGNVIKPDIKESIFGAVVNQITRSLEAPTKDFLERSLRELVHSIVATKIEEIITQLFDYEFTEVSRYGEPKETTTLRMRIFKDIEAMMVFKPTTYRSDESRFTSCIRELVEAETKKFKPVFDKEINARFTNECMNYATEQLQKKLGLKK